MLHRWDYRTQFCDGRNLQNLADPDGIIFQSVKCLDLGYGHPKLFADQNERIPMLYLVESGPAFWLGEHWEGSGSRRWGWTGHRKSPVFLVGRLRFPFPLYRVFQPGFDAFREGWFSGCRLGGAIGHAKQPNS